MRPGPKPRLDETRFIPRTSGEEEQLFLALVQTGTGAIQALNMIRRLKELEQRDRLDNALSASLSLYRKRLERLGSPPWEREGTAPPRLRLSVLTGPTGAIGGYINSTILLARAA